MAEVRPACPGIGTICGLVITPTDRGSLVMEQNGSYFFKTFRVLNSVLRLIPNMHVNSLTGSPCWYRRRSRFCWAASSFIGLVAAFIQ
jgi:hypothetical protein